jgi:hypothetical protein
VRRRLIGYVLDCLGITEHFRTTSQLTAAVNAHGEQIDAITDRLHDMDARISEFDVKGAKAA